MSHNEPAGPRTVVRPFYLTTYRLTTVDRQRGASAATLYEQEGQYGGLEVSEAKRLRALEDENRKLKKVLRP